MERRDNEGYASPNREGGTDWKQPALERNEEGEDPL
jgi:hypothetical protein